MNDPQQESSKLPSWLFSVRARLAALMSVLIALVAILVYWYGPHLLEEKSKAAIAERSRAIGAILAYNVSLALQNDDRRAVWAGVIGAKRTAGLDYVMVLDASGQVIASYDSLRAVALRYQHTDAVDRISEDEQTYQTMLPVIVQAKLLGRVYVGLSLDEMHAEIRQARTTIAIVSFGFAVVGIAVTFLILRLAAKPLIEMARTAQRLAEGDWSRRVPVRSNDEIGKLAVAFNTMLDNLSVAYQKLHHSERSYRDLFENASDLILSVCPEGMFEFANRAFLETLGFTQHEITQLHIQHIVADAELPSFEKVMERTLHGETVDRFQTVLIARNGREITVEGSLGCRVESGTVLSVCGIFRDITERKRAEEAILLEKARFEQLFQNAPVGILLIDPAKRIVSANREFQQMFGYPLQELVGRTIHETIVPAALSQEGDELFGKVLHGEPVRRETMRRAKEGRLLDVQIYGVPIVINGEAIGVFGLYVDVTQQKRAEEAIRLEKARFEQLFENAPIGIILADSDERILHANSRFQAMFGFSLEEIRGRSINETIVPESLRHEGNELSHRVLTGEPIQTESVRMRKDGTHLNVNIFGVPIMMNGEAVGVFGMYVDITARKKAEVELARLVHAVRSVTEGICITDTDENILFVNKAFQRIYDYTAEELIGKSVTILRAESDREVPVRSATLEGAWQGELLSKRKDGSIFPIYLSTSAVRDEEGRMIALVGVCTDITEKKREEEQRAKLMRDLEVINKELNDFAYIVSHDLKAPLRAIGTLVNWLATDYGDKLGDEGKELLTMLLGRTKRMHDLIDGVLRYSRIGRTKEQITEVNLDTLVSEIVDLIVPPPNVQVKIQRPLPTIVAETTRMQQVFQNLLSNAVKFMDKPQGVIEVGCVRENGQWKFHVADNGPGIEERHFNKIFQIFQTLSPRDEHESTGVGLTIVKKIIEMYGGSIWVESKVGEGTTFHFTLPAEMNH
ncbi:MAG: hypothetical protein C4326_10020 [Ignavibacteria bacterium]